jgi:hypothetical protein
VTVTDNPAAFPLPGYNEDGPGGYPAEPGMSLRDWFAGQALAGFCSVCMGDGEPLMGAKDTARAAYNYADAMLAERIAHPSHGEPQ